MAIRSDQMDADLAKALHGKEQKLLEETPTTTEATAATFTAGDPGGAENPSPAPEATPVTPQPLTPAEKRAEAVLLKRGAKKGTTFKEKAGMTIFGLILCIFGYFLWSVSRFPAGLCYAMGILFLLGGLFSNQRRARPGSRQGETTLYTADVLDALLPLLELPPLEKRYGELLTALAREPSPLAEEDRLEMIELANGLLSDHRALSARRAEIETGLAETDLAGMEAERDRLRAEAGKADDPVVAEARLHTATLLEERLEDARVVRRTAERMRAQEEAVFETMAALHSSLTRLSLAPTGLKQADTDSLREIVDRTRRQTHAVEDAVAEVMSVTGRS